jgi:hypothetical protein
LNFERAPLKLQRAIKSKREREREREKEGGEKPWAACGKRKHQGQSDFLGQKFWQTIKEIQALDSPEN